MARLLITGASGLLGFNIALSARSEHDVFAAYHTQQMYLPNTTPIQSDLTKKNAVRSMIERSRPDWIIHCAAATNVDLCERNPSFSTQLNRDLAKDVALAAMDYGASLIHISTDAVFDGDRGDYEETDPPNPINTYARSKLEGEEAVLDAYPQAMVVRTNLFGWSRHRGNSLSEWFLNKLESKEPCQGFVDTTFSPLLVNDLALILLQMLKRSLHGIFHAGSSNCLSKFDFGVEIAEMSGNDPKLIQPSYVDAFGFPARRAKKLCLNSGKLEGSLGITMPSIEAGLERFLAMRSDWQQEKWETIPVYSGRDLNLS
jgi:dTDP-4-dehydrorhamnose reductase